MAIDATQEELLSLAQAAKVMPPVNGKRPAVSTLWRWCRKGLGGVRLDYVRVGRNIATSREAMSRFFNALAAKDEPITDPPRTERPLVRTTSGSRQMAIESADRFCQEAGL